MNRLILLVTTSLFALAGGCLAESHPVLLAAPRVDRNPLHPPSHVLYSQNSNFGQEITSQNFSGDFSVYNSAAADDFVIPAGRKWAITEVDVTGGYFNGKGPASSEVVVFYSNEKGHPGKMEASYTLNCTDSNGTFACTL